VQEGGGGWLGKRTIRRRRSHTTRVGQGPCNSRTGESVCAVVVVVVVGGGVKGRHADSAETTLNEEDGRLPLPGSCCTKASLGRGRSGDRSRQTLRSRLCVVCVGMVWGGCGGGGRGGGGGGAGGRSGREEREGRIITHGSHAESSLQQRRVDLDPWLLTRQYSSPIIQRQHYTHAPKSGTKMRVA
jgi:hypothetical protein